MAPSGDPVTLDEAIAAGVRRLRGERGWTQDDLALAMRRRGLLGWSRSMVAALETRRRQVSAGDLFALSVGLGVGPGDLLAGAPDLVSLDDGTSVPSEQVRRLLRGDLRALDRPPRPTAPAHLPGARVGGGGSGPTPVELAAASGGRLEGAIAAKEGLDPVSVAAAAFRLWGRSATEERDARARDSGAARQSVSRAVRREIADSLLRAGRPHPTHRPASPRGR